MNSVNRSLIRRKYYLDSVALMRASKTLAALPDVIEAAMMMGTPANIEIMQNAGLLDAERTSHDSISAGDLVISVRAKNPNAVDTAFEHADELLASSSASIDASQWRPRSIRSAVANRANTNLALISVPGEFAVSEARKAVRRGLHAMIFSDNVPLEQEVALKKEAVDLGRLVMGPDCGTAIINGVPLAFANKVPRGSIGIIGASGTGMQEVTSLIAQQGVGISQAIGVGGRDLKDAVGGLMSTMALNMLIADSNTRHVVLISKPASQSIVDKLLALLATSDKTATLCFLGGEKTANLPANCQWASTLHEAATLAMTAIGINVTAPDSAIDPSLELSRSGKLVRGLFCGGTLCTEAQVLFSRAGIRTTSNVPLDDSNHYDHNFHTILDLGDDEYTRGKPHPMIDPSSRDAPVLEALRDVDVGVLLVDMVIGYGAHENPAGQFVDCIQESGTHSTLIIASVTGTEADPQCLSTQRSILTAAGVHVASSNALAVQSAIAAIGPNS